MREKITLSHLGRHTRTHVCSVHLDHRFGAWEIITASCDRFQPEPSSAESALRTKSSGCTYVNSIMKCFVSTIRTRYQPGKIGCTEGHRDRVLLCYCSGYIEKVYSLPIIINIGGRCILRMESARLLDKQFYKNILRSIRLPLYYV